MRRSFSANLLAETGLGTTVMLVASEAHHLRNVLRIAVGERVELFDGCGWSAAGEVCHLSRAEVLVQLVAAPVRDPVRKPLLWLAVAAPKQDRLRWLVEKGTELGVDRISLLVTARKIVEPGAGKLQKLHDAAVQACKQCGRNDLPTLDAPQPLSDWLASWRTESRSPQSLLLTADPAGAPLLATLAERGYETPDVVAALIGPEGGLTDDECAAAQEAGALGVNLVRHILRIETAALAAAASLRAAWPGLNDATESTASNGAAPL